MILPVLFILWSTASAQRRSRVKFTSVDYRIIEQLEGIGRLVKLEKGVVATCNLVLITKPAQFRKAEESCRSFNIGTGPQQGQLVTVNNDDKNWSIRLMLGMGLKYQYDSNTMRAWTGMRKRQSTEGEVRKESEGYSPEDWEWADGTSPGSYSNWGKDKPDSRILKFGEDGCYEKPACLQNFMRLDQSGKWDDGFQHTEHPYICEYEGRFVVSGERRSHEEAKKECRDAGLELARIRSDGDLEELKNATDYFLGPYSGNSTESSSIWIGGRRREKTVSDVNWEFSDCEKIEWDIKWEKSPEEPLRVEVLIMSRWGTVDFESKDGNPRPFACQCPNS